MKITRKQLRQIIEENLVLNEIAPLAIAGVGAIAFAGWLFGKTYKMARSSNEETIQDHLNLAAELEYNYDYYTKIFETLYTHANSCNDSHLLKELSQYIKAGEAIADLIPGFDFDMSDKISAFADAALLGGTSQATSAGIVLAKGAKPVASSGAKIFGSALSFLFAAYDVYDTEEIINKVRNQVNLDKMHDDMQGFTSLYQKILKNELPC